MEEKKPCCCIIFSELFYFRLPVSMSGPRTRWVGVWKLDLPPQGEVREDKETLTLLPSGEAIIERKRLTVKGYETNITCVTDRNNTQAEEWEVRGSWRETKVSLVVKGKKNGSIMVQKISSPLMSEETKH